MTSTKPAEQRYKPPTIPLTTGGRLVGVGRTLAYETARRTGCLIEGVPVIRVGRRLRVPVAPLEAALGIDIRDHLSDDDLSSDHRDDD